MDTSFEGFTRGVIQEAVGKEIEYAVEDAVKIEIARLRPAIELKLWRSIEEWTKEEIRRTLEREKNK
jgi:hypothetical protein